MIRERDRAQRGRQRRTPHRGPGAAVRRGRRAPVQPQSRDLAVLLPPGGDHPHVGGAPAHLSPGAGPGHGAVLRRPHRDGRDPTPSGSSCWSSCKSSTPPRSPSTSSIPRPGTPLGDAPPVAAWEAIRWIALFRLGLPGVILRYAGGREVTLRDLQAMGMTSGINALIVGNYLTTLGRSADEDLRMLADLRMPVGALTGVL